MSHLLLCVSKNAERAERPGFWAPYYLIAAETLVDPLPVNAHWEILDDWQGNINNGWTIGLLEIVIDGGRDDSAMQAGIESDNKIFSFSLELGWRDSFVSDIPQNIKARLSNQVGVGDTVLNADSLPTAIDKIFIEMGFGNFQAVVDIFNQNAQTNYTP